MSHPGESGGYEATIEQWGRITWHVTYRNGLMGFEDGDFAFTRRRAEAKAQRTMAKMKAADERYRKRYVVIPSGSAQPPNPPPRPQRPNPTRPSL